MGQVLYRPTNTNVQKYNVPAKRASRASYTSQLDFVCSMVPNQLVTILWIQCVAKIIKYILLDLPLAGFVLIGTHAASHCRLLPITGTLPLFYSERM